MLEKKRQNVYAYRRKHSNHLKGCVLAMTHRLYYDETYLTQFDGTVTAVREKNGKTIVSLNQSAFYPTSGGQPFDTGTLNCQPVTDVFVDEDGEVWHEVAGALAVGEAVHGQIDWPRRFDHMQQHAGEHMLAGAIYRQLGGGTIGLHLGAEVSTIDVTLPDGATHLTSGQILSLEEDVNRQIQQDVPIRCWFPKEDELSRLPLRKAPTVKEHVRVVAIGELEMVACGGTHPSTAGQIGLVKIVDARPSRGKLRVGFVCGMRAFRDYQRRMNASDEAAALLSAPVEQLPLSVRRMQENLAALRQELTALRKEQALARAEALMASAESLNGVRLISGALPALPADTLREMATELTGREQAIVMLTSPREGGGCLALFARSEAVDLDMGKLLRQACAACGGKGGGRADFAQGSAPDAEVLTVARGLLDAWKPDETQY